jgi:hypothetical protein
MARPKKEPDLVRIHVEITKRDLDALRSLFASTIGISASIRIAIRKFLTDHEARAREIIDRNTR